MGINDCVMIGRIALGLCKSVQSRSSSLYPSANCSAWISGMCRNFMIVLGLCGRNDCGILTREYGLCGCLRTVVLLWEIQDE